MLLGALALLAALSNSWVVQAESAASTEAGMPAWSPAVRVSTTSSSGAFGPAVATSSSGDILIAYTDAGATAKNPTFVRSSDNGATWTVPASIHTSGQDSEQISVDYGSDGQAVAVWRENTSPNQLRFARQAQWSSNAFSVVYASPTEPEYLFDPAIAVAPSGTIHVVWAQVTITTQRNIYHTQSLDNGATWSTPTPLATDNRDSVKPALAVTADNRVHVAWEENTLRIDPDPVPAIEIQHVVATPGSHSLSWTTPEVLTPDFTKAVDPYLVAIGDVIHVSFARQGADPALEQYAYHMFRAASGAWSTPADTTHDTAIGVNGSDPRFMVTALTSCGGTVHLYYHGTYLQSENERIYGGNLARDWHKEEVNTGLQLTTRAINPALGCTNKLHLALERIESEQNFHQVYYLRGTLPGQAFLPTLLR
jgi:hypothetical protein